MIKHDGAILLDTSGPQDQVGMRAEIPIGSNRESAVTGAGRIEDSEIAHRATGVATARLDHAEGGRCIHRREQAILFEGMTDGNGWDPRTESTHEVEHGLWAFLCWCDDRADV